MTIFTPSTSPRVTYAKNLDSTSAVTLVSAAQKENKTLESLMVSCSSGGATAFSLIYNNGTTDFPIINAKTVAASDTLQITDHHITLRYGQSLKVQAATANRLTVTAVTLDAPPQQVQGGGG